MSDNQHFPRAYHTPEPFSRPISSIILAPTLEPIPGSAVVTPAARESPKPRSYVPEADQLDEEDLSRALNKATLGNGHPERLSEPVSYFTPVVNQSTSTSGLITPGKQRPAIDIPVPTPDQPSFSSYPRQISVDQTAVPTTSKGKAFANFVLRHPSIRSKSSLRRRHHTPADSEEEGLVTSDDEYPSPTSRRRSTSLSLAEARPRKPIPTPRAPNRVFGRRRAGSVGARRAAEYHEGDDEAWKEMANVESARLDPKADVPFTYQQSVESQFTLQSNDSTVRPLTTPPISPRRSSLSSADFPISIVASQEVIGGSEGAAMPHDPPPRRSSLDLTSLSASMPCPEVTHELVPLDARFTMSSSLVSSSVTCSDPSLFSSSTSSQEHPLSSATTSLSRSAKSAKEGADEHDAALSAVRLQRSLEWEAKQTKRRRRLDKRKMVLLELVETEVAYAEGLRALVQVYLPQLAALPGVSARTASMIARNSSELLEYHANLATRMVEILKIERIGYDIIHDPDVPVERASRKISALFVEHLSLFAGYNQFCAGSIAAATLVRHIGLRADYDSYERRCQIIWASHSPVTLQDLLAVEQPNGELAIRSRLRFRDYLIMPIQRICRYPLLLGQLSSTALTPSVENHDSDSDDTGDVGVDVGMALNNMRLVASAADEARRIKEAEVKSATILERLEPHVALSPSFIKSLGTCRLIGSLDVLHHHRMIAPLVPPVKVKYLAAFLYRGYLILAKVKRGKVYEAKHFLPLEVFELIDIAEGFLPHSVRLTLRDHNFELAASCEAEKDVWAAALREARDEGVIPPFELPASVSPFAAKSRRMSAAHLPTYELNSPRRPSLDLDSSRAAESVGSVAMAQSTPLQMANTGLSAEMRSSQSSTVLLRRPSTNARLYVDRCLLDVFSESCAQARSRAQLSQPLFLPDVTSHDIRDRISMRESTMLRRRTSFLDHKSNSFDIAFHGEVRGSVIPVRQTKSQHGRSRAARPRSGSIGDDSATDLGVSADETITNSDHGHYFHQRASSGYSTAVSTPATPLLGDETHRYPISDMDATRPSSLAFSPRGGAHQTLPMRVRNQAPLLRRKTASSANLKGKPSQLRTRSMPVSPSDSPTISEDPPPLPPKPDTLSRDRESLNLGISYFPLNTDVESSAGLGLIESSMDSERPKSWHTLRRSMSFLRSGSKTDDIPSSSPSSYFPDLSTIGTSQRPASYASSSSISGLQSSPSTSLSQFGFKSPAAKSSDDVTLAAGESGSASNTPKRKKSLLLTRLRGFTAM